MVRALLIVLLLLQDTTTEKPPWIRPLKGDLRVWRAGAKKIDPIKEETTLAKDDRFGTAKGEYALFSTEGDTMISIKGVEVGKEKGLSIERAGKKLVLKLHEGKLLLETFETELVVDTPFGRVEGRQAYFVVEVTDKSTKVVALDGKLTFTNSLGSVEVGSEQESTATKDKKPGDPKPTDVSAAARELAKEEAARNMIQNPGFESGLEKWVSEAHNGKKVASLADQLSHTGKSCVRLEASTRIYGATKPTWLPFHQDVDVVPGKRYFIRAYVRSETREGTVGPMFKVDQVEGEAVSRPSCEKEWKMARITFTAKNPVCRVLMMVEVKTDRFECVIWMDDLFMAELPK